MKTYKIIFNYSTRKTYHGIITENVILCMLELLNDDLELG